MALLPFANPDTLPQKAKDAFDRLPRKLNIFRMWANAPECFVSGLRFGGNILARQKLRPALRELAILLVARLEGGGYEWVQHVPIAEEVGCRKEQIDALEHGRLDDPAFDARERILLRFAREVVRDVKASEDAVHAMLQHFSAQEIVEVILTCGFYMTMARLTETTRTEIDAPGGMAVLNELGRMG